MLRFRRVLTAVAALTAVASLSACGGAQAGAAAVVGGDRENSVGADRRITVGEVQDASSQLTGLLSAEAGFTQPVVLGQLILAPYVLAAGAQLGLGISDDDVREQLKIQLEGDAAQSGAPAKPVDLDAESLTVLRSVLTLNTLQQTGAGDTAQLQQFIRAVQGAVTADGVDVSPRYGNFDVNQLTVAPETPNWLQAAPTEEPTAPAPEGAQP